ncbi:MAG TPA: hypothetical protein VLB67_13635 [Acidimicrobiia bacterium]|nr:hypothetical protein [Acidimicrobiia bacterium]
MIGIIDYRVLMVAMGVSVAMCAIPIATFGRPGGRPQSRPEPSALDLADCATRWGGIHADRISRPMS